MFPYQQRVVDEKRDLDRKIENLQVFIGMMAFDDIDNGEKSRIRIQLEIMGAYSCILGERIAHFERGVK